MNTESLHWDISKQNFCLWDWNLENGTIGLSKNWLDILGVGLHEYRPSSSWFNSLIHPDDLGLVLYQLEIHLSGLQQSDGFSFRLKTKSHEYVRFESKGIIVLQSDSGVPGHVVWACEKTETVLN